MGLLFTTYGGLYGTAYVHHVADAGGSGGGATRGVRAAWYGALMPRNRDAQHLIAGASLAERVTGLTVWPGHLSGRVPVQDARPAYAGADPDYPRSVVVSWPVVSDAEWRLLAAAARPHAHRLAEASGRDAMLRILELADSLGVVLLPALGEIIESDCPCRARRSVCKHIAALIECYSRSLEHEPLTLLLLAGRSPADYFALVDDPDHPSAQPRYRPEQLTEPTTDARDLYYRRQWRAIPALPPLPTPPAPAGPTTDDPAAAGPRPGPGARAQQVLARAAADRAANLLHQALQPRRNPLADPVRQLTPKQDAARLATSYGSPGPAPATS